MCSKIMDWELAKPCRRHRCCNAHFLAHDVEGKTPNLGLPYRTMVVRDARRRTTLGCTSITTSLDDVMWRGLRGGPVLMDACRTVALSGVAVFSTTWLTRSIVLISYEMGRRRGRSRLLERTWTVCDESIMDQFMLPTRRWSVLWGLQFGWFALL